MEGWKGVQHALALMKLVNRLEPGWWLKSAEILMPCDCLMCPDKGFRNPG